MKTNNPNNRNKQVRYPRTVRKITKLLCIATFATGIIGSLIIEESIRLNDIIFYSFCGTGAILGWITMKLTPNADQYRCKSCGHIHIPDCRATMRGKMRVHCPACNQNTVHKYVLPEKIAGNLENLQ